MKILHIGTDDKFLDHAFPIFENAFPGANDVFVFSRKSELKLVKLTPNYVETKRSRLFWKKPKLSGKVYKEYDVVVFHSLDRFIYPEIFNIPESTSIIWLGWGFDYYYDLLLGSSLYLKKTKRMYLSSILKNPRIIVSMVIHNLIWALKFRTMKVRAIETISFFAPVLPEEHRMVKMSRKWRNFPEYLTWNYGTLEDNLIRGFEGESVTGNAILVGNSATYTGNHSEIFDLLAKLNVLEQRIVCPLSYGDKALGDKLNKLGKEYFGRNFEPLMNFMPIEKYVDIIKSCGYVIMNHVRQQAVGNIVIMLYLGARVFVRRENPIYEYFRSLGVAISTVQDLEVNPFLLKLPLTSEERLSNRTIISDYWSRERAFKRTQYLVERALGLKSEENPKLAAESKQ